MAQASRVSAQTMATRSLGERPRRSSSGAALGAVTRPAQRRRASARAARASASELAIHQTLAAPRPRDRRDRRRSRGLPGGRPGALLEATRGGARRRSASTPARASCEREHEELVPAFEPGPAAPRLRRRRGAEAPGDLRRRPGRGPAPGRRVSGRGLRAGGRRGAGSAAGAPAAPGVSSASGAGAASASAASASGSAAASPAGSSAAGPGTRRRLRTAVEAPVGVSPARSRTTRSSKGPSVDSATACALSCSAVATSGGSSVPVKVRGSRCTKVRRGGES